MEHPWTWDQDPPLRWLLVDEYTGDTGAALGVCAGIDGLFAEPEPPPEPERFTLVGCDPAGPLREALQAASAPSGDVQARAWLPAVMLDPVHSDPVPGGCQRYDVGCSCMEELFDVEVLGHRPSIAGDGLVDAELRGRLRILPEMHWPPAHPPEARGFLLHGQGNEPLGSCRSTIGVFHDRPFPVEQPVTLVGCRPEEPLLTLMRRRSARNRHLQATVHAVDAAGRAARTYKVLSAVVIGSAPSRLDAGLLDITLHGGFDEPFPDGAREIYDLWYAGRPSRRNLWAGYDRGLRHEWAGAALFHRPHQPDRPPGLTYDLDGRFVTDIEGFYCAVGEAVNGPGGYFGWNLDAFDDCLRGGWGAARPFRLVWHHAEVARDHLVPGYDRPPYDLRSWGPAVTMDDLLGMFARAGVTVQLR
ncbi:barstar family protein [Microbispora sp. ZYX-F-249]|uniref:Barstar family protein n=1 Tax=Microbispora maris TaxID=3144104 RepID=A0ABV0AQV0_9ACTN